MQIKNENTGTKKWQNAIYLVPIAILHKGQYNKNAIKIVSNISAKLPIGLIIYYWLSDKFLVLNANIPAHYYATIEAKYPL